MSGERGHERHFREAAPRAEDGAMHPDLLEAEEAEAAEILKRDAEKDTGKPA